MPRQRKETSDDRISMTVRVDKETYEAVAIYCVRNRTSIQDVLEQGLRSVMKAKRIQAQPEYD